MLDARSLTTDVPARGRPRVHVSDNARRRAHRDSVLAAGGCELRTLLDADARRDLQRLVLDGLTIREAVAAALSLLARP